MPTYDFRCKSCGAIFEKALTLKEHEKPVLCIVCNNECEQWYTKMNFIFKTGGFYKIDSRKETVK